MSGFSEVVWCVASSCMWWQSCSRAYSEAVAGVIENPSKTIGDKSECYEANK